MLLARTLIARPDPATAVSHLALNDLDIPDSASLLPPEVVAC